MTIEEMLQIKKEYGYSYKLISEMSGVPLATVQKVLGGQTDSPRRETLKALEDTFNQIKTPNFYLAESHPFGKSKKSEYNSMNESINAYNTGSSAYDMGGHTIDEYIALPEGTRVELIDGFFYDMAAPTYPHQYISGLIFNDLMNFVTDNNGPCIPFAAPADVQLDCDNKTMVQPDIFVICDRDKIIKERLVGAPDFIIEILSPSNWYMDVNIKLNKYKNAGVREYWIIFPDKKRIAVHKFDSADYNDEPIQYTFDDIVPVGIWDDKCMIDFKKIKEKLKLLFPDF